VASKRSQGTSKRHHRTLGNLEKNLKYVKHIKNKLQKCQSTSRKLQGMPRNSENLSCPTWKMMRDIEQHQKHIWQY
jgi:ribosomal protein L34E